MKSNKPALEELKRSLRLLAAPAHEQLAYLKEIGCDECVDELALELDDVMPAGAMRADLTLTEKQLRDVQQVQAELDAISGPDNAEVWQPDALAKRGEWIRVRQAASHALAAL